MNLIRFFIVLFNCIQDMTTRFNKSLNFRKCQPTISENLSHEQLSYKTLLKVCFLYFKPMQYSANFFSLFDSTEDLRNLNCSTLRVCCVIAFYIRKNENEYIFKRNKLKVSVIGETSLLSLGQRKGVVFRSPIRNYYFSSFYSFFKKEMFVILLAEQLYSKEQIYNKMVDAI